MLSLEQSQFGTIKANVENVGYKEWLRTPSRSSSQTVCEWVDEGDSVRQDGKGKEGWMRQTSGRTRGHAPGRRRKIPAGIRGIRVIRRLVSSDRHSLDELASCQQAKKSWASRVGCLSVSMINGRSIGGMERKEIVKRQRQTWVDWRRRARLLSGKPGLEGI